jgi:hypothetical protein
MKRILVTLLLFWSSLSAAQCAANPSGGTACVGPLAIATPANPTTAFVFTPATSSFMCPSGNSSAWSLCGQNGALMVDYGAGYVSLKGDKGDPGLPGVDGTNGVNGTNGTNGTDGMAATIAIGSVTSGPTPSVTNSGTPTNATLNFVLQPGAPGVNPLPIGGSITVTESCNVVNGARTCILKRTK